MEDEETDHWHVDLDNALCDVSMGDDDMLAVSFLSPSGDTVYMRMTYPTSMRMAQAFIKINLHRWLRR